MEISTRILVEVCSAGLSTASSALASSVLKTPLGAGGGAAHGAFYYLCGRPISYVTNILTGANEEDAPKIAKLISGAGAFFAGNACAWSITNSIYDLTTNDFSYVDSLELGGTSMGFSLSFAIPIICLVGCFVSNYSSSESPSVNSNILRMLEAGANLQQANSPANSLPAQKEPKIDIENNSSTNESSNQGEPSIPAASSQVEVEGALV